MQNFRPPQNLGSFCKLESVYQNDDSCHLYMHKNNDNIFFNLRCNKTLDIKCSDESFT